MQKRRLYVLKAWMPWCLLSSNGAVSCHLMTLLNVVGHDVSYYEYEMWHNLKHALHRIYLSTQAHVHASFTVISIILSNCYSNGSIRSHRSCWSRSYMPGGINMHTHTWTYLSLTIFAGLRTVHNTWTVTPPMLYNQVEPRQKLPLPLADPSPHLGQLSLASLCSRLIKYQLRLG